jgi:hypothetical protein
VNFIKYARKYFEENRRRKNELKNHKKEIKEKQEKLRKFFVKLNFPEAGRQVKG